MSVPTSDSEAVEYLITLIYQRSRIRLHEGKVPLIRARLGKRMRHHGFESLNEYCHYLRNGRDPEELTQVVDALTTNYTMFLREKDHFEFLTERALPSVLTPGQKRFQVWSAACATGEEPYSMAIYLSERFPLAEGWDWQILGTDISTRALAQAERGVYPQERVSTVPPDWLRRSFQRGQGQWEGHYRIKPQLQQRVRFQQFNLLGDQDPAGPFEVIFCRNVMIYFDRPTQQQLGNRLCRMLRPRGFLMVGHSESLNGFDLPLRCLKPSVYQKV